MTQARVAKALEGSLEEIKQEICRLDRGIVFDATTDVIAFLVPSIS